MKHDILNSNRKNDLCLTFTALILLSSNHVIPRFEGKKWTFCIFFKFYFIILYWFCHTSTWICHGCTCVPNPEPPSHFPPHAIPLGHPSAPAPSILYPVSCIEPRLAIHFLHDSIHVSMPFSQIIPPSPSPRESKRLFYTSVSLLLSRIQGYHYHLSKFHIYVLVYCIGVSLSGLLHSVLWRRKWKPTPVFLPGESQGQGSLVGVSLSGLLQSVL